MRRRNFSDLVIRSATETVIYPIMDEWHAVGGCSMDIFFASMTIRTWLALFGGVFGLIALCYVLLADPNKP